MTFEEYIEDLYWGTDSYGIVSADLGQAWATVYTAAGRFAYDLEWGYGEDVWHDEAFGFATAAEAQEAAERKYWDTMVEEAEVARAEAIADRRSEDAEMGWRRH